MGSPFRILDAKFRKQRSGLIDASLSYIVPGPVEAGGAEPWGVLDTYEGEDAPLGLPLVGRSAEKQSDGDWLLNLEYQGITGDKAGFVDVEWDMAKIENPIERHPKFKRDVVKKLGARFDQDEPYIFKGWEPEIIDPAGGKKIQNPYYGIDSYNANAPQLRVAYLSKEFDHAALKNLARIDTPVAPGSDFKSPESPDGKSWLKTYVSGSLKGNVWEMRVVWELGRWAQFFYAPEA